MISTQGKRPLIALLAAAGLMTACHHSDDNTITPPPVSTNPPPVVNDAFVTYVGQQVATVNEDSEPLATDGITPTTPEDSEPLPLPGP